MEENGMEYTTKILIADESPASRAAMREGLVRMGYRNVEEAVNGEEALQKINRNRPDVVLLDVWLSKLDGIGVCAAAGARASARTERRFSSSCHRSPTRTCSFRQPKPARSCACSNRSTSTASVSTFKASCPGVAANRQSPS